MREFTQKTQSFWYFFTELALLLVVLAGLQLYDVVTIDLDISKVWMLSGILFAIGAGFGFGALETNERALFWKYKLVWLLLVLIGLGLSLYAIYFNIQAEPWIETFITGFLFLLFGMILFFASMNGEQREAFYKLWPLYVLFFLVSFSLGLFGFAEFYVSGGGVNETLSGFDWEFFFALAGVFGALSYVPLAYTIGEMETGKGKVHKLWIVWLLLSLIGIVIYLLAGAEILADVDLLGGASQRQGALLLGLAFQAPGFIFLVSSTGKEELIQKFTPIYFLLTFVGVGLAFASEFVTSLPVSTNGLGAGLVVISAGLYYKSISLDYVEAPTGPTGQFTQRTATAAQGTKLESNFAMPNSLTTDERVYVINLQKKINENTISMLGNATKSNKLSKDYVQQLIGNLTEANRNFDSQIVSIKEQAKRSSRKSIFEDALSSPSDTKASSPQNRSTPPASSGFSAPSPASPPPPAQNSPPMPPPSPAPTTPPPSSSGPPMPPSSSGPPMPPSSSGPPMPPSSSGPPMPPSSSGPPMPPSSSGPPMPPSSSGPPMPPSSSGPPMPPSSSGPPKPPSSSGPPKPPSSSGPPSPPGPSSAPPSPASSGSSGAPARSTSIAELRGEMLKELRRLRDIFNEDG